MSDERERATWMSRMARLRRDGLHIETGDDLVPRDRTSTTIPATRMPTVVHWVDDSGSVVRLLTTTPTSE